MSDQSTRGLDGEREVPAECVRLAVRLRELRAVTGLSLARLADKTPYSKSSWDRYLNARAMPPRHAVEQLCALAGKQPQRPVALWELAEAAWSCRAGRSTQDGERAAHCQDTAWGMPEGVSASAVAPLADTKRIRPRISWLYVGILGGVSALAAGLLIALSPSGDGPAGNRAATTDFAAPSIGCHAASCTGKGPEDQDCSTAKTPPVELGEHRFAGTVVKIRHSEVCETVWARIDRGVVGDQVEIVVPGSRVHQVVVQDRFDEMGSVSTPMAAAADDILSRVQACLARKDERRCFSVTPD
ncbi:helix-turn-helix domain-containing protein [Streptomyces sp. NBC_01314]|uniref:helix-turn-helix domain-containing protein n=1 Tax=Streptomyces sp. NBC_01314 TaxID=2903821 RepID=UPI00308AB68C|nr:helix-turn-helix domain-containing protein [Streptomyces sp. NBC_01314]